MTASHLLQVVISATVVTVSKHGGATMSSNKVSMGIPNLSSTQISKMVSTAYHNKMSILFYGSPGTGKSQGVIAGAKELAKELGLREVVNPSNENDKGLFGVYLRIMSMFAPEDVNGIPFVTDDVDGGKITKFAKTGFVPTTEGIKGVIFLDEIGNAEEYKFGPLQSLLTERKIGNFDVPEGVQFILATNKPEDGTGARELPSAIRNRCMQFDVIAPHGEDFINMMDKIGRKLHKNVEGFLLTFPAETYTFDPAKTASATLRTWEQISKMMDNFKSIQEEILTVGSLVGTDISSKYKAWRKLSDKFKLSDIISNPSSINDYEHDKGLLYNICINLLEHAEKAKKNIPDLFNIAIEIEHDEFSIYLIRNLVKKYNHSVLSEAIRNSSNAKKISEKLIEYKDFYYGVD